MRFFLFAFMLLPLSCVKDKSCKTCEKDAVTTTAKVVWTGAVAVDGCDWCIKTDSVTFYHPDVLGAAFQQDQLDVTITYKLTTDRYGCGLSGKGPFVIHVLSIKK